MLNRYLFKAKGYDGELVAGFLIFNEEGNAFIQNWGDPEEVDENTICQCTGLEDKEDTLIYENDIVETSDGEFVVEWDEYEGRWVLCQYGSVMYDFSDFEPSAVKVNGNKLYESES